MIGSLSGTMEEVFTAKEVVRQYNQEKAESSGKLFLPIEWSIKPEYLRKVDVVIGIVGNFIDNQSFIEECVKTGKRVMLFFKAFQDPKNTIQSEHDEVQAFRERMHEVCNCFDYRVDIELQTNIKAEFNSIVTI